MKYYYYVPNHRIPTTHAMGSCFWDISICTIPYSEQYTISISIPSGHQQCLKDRTWWRTQQKKPQSLISAIEPESHARIRKLLAPGFTPRALRAQEPILQRYVSLLVERLREHISETANSKGTEINILPWINFTTFDIFADLGFGESFDCLQSSRYHPWIALLFNSVKAASFIAAARFYPLVDFLLIKCIPLSLKKMQQAYFQQIADKVERRLNYDKGGGLSVGEINATFIILTSAGSETTATALAGTMNCLVQNPDKLRILETEIRARFRDETEITLDALHNLPYPNAALNEGLRLCPPVAWILPRRMPVGGDTVCDFWLPGDTRVSIQEYVTNHDPTYFHDTSAFRPERWLPEASADPKSPFFADQLDAVQPCSVGSRSCTGQHIANFLLVEKKPIEVRMRLREGVSEQ
ncbi:cytochrome P450 [Biscogniauxia mediterranea]|nr:cytochrome P450 [Biscogniauxia mediterranea]